MVNMLKGTGHESREKPSTARHLDFARENVEATSHIPLRNRDYGFMKTSKAGTPFPKKTVPFNPQMLTDRLQSAHRSSVTSMISESKTTISSESSLALLTQAPLHNTEMTFEMKRKLFDQGEFTITRGKKTSDMFHPTIEYKLPKYSKRDSHQHALQEMEEYCRAMNIKISKGFDN
ncbi:uncharacterized protein I-t [Drosophila virilis]|uniref:Uncharacterized protein n=1 Tax=Drosophila virilis TaxID=7244 RepID=A0A0Q9W1J3_DROVI|nr:uncharacterized protein LOC26530714 [Drosophila virilis]KRF78861.1 uncharacterized protein Dvir_GJ25944 [Drosophila virilis]